MAVDVAQMSDGEICNLMRGHTQVTPTPPTGIQTKFNQNPCFQCGLLGHKAANCPYVQKDKLPEIGGKFIILWKLIPQWIRSCGQTFSINV